MRVVLVALCLALSMASCIPWRRPQAECYAFSQLPRVFSHEFSGVRALSGRFSLKVSKGGRVGIMRGEFVYEASCGLWAVGYGPFGGQLLEARIRDSSLQLLFAREGVLYEGEPRNKRGICLTFERTEGEGYPSLIRGRAGPWDFTLRLKDLKEEAKPLPPLHIPPGTAVFPLEDLFELLWP